MTNSSSISFHYEYDDFKLEDESLIQNWLTQLVLKEHHEYSDINYIFLDDEALLNVNQEFLNHDYYTDIITFPMHDDGEPIEADIYISIDRVKDNADEYNSAFISELHRVMAHGLMHLCGYSDKEPSEAKVMKEKEDASLKLLNEIQRST